MAIDRLGVIRVRAPGLLTTVQDLGRPGLGKYGIAPGGALDRRALILGNRLVANEPGEAGLEITLTGPALDFTCEAVITLSGADLGARLNGKALPLWRPVVVRAGDKLDFDPAAARHGVRAYLCVAGGLALEPALGSRSTDLAGGFGGFNGRALQAGDELPLRGTERSIDDLLRRRLAGPAPAPEAEVEARVVLGPQTEWFTVAGIETLLSHRFAVSARSDRMGVRLSGPAVEHARPADILSEGIAHGAIQVPGDGQPIVLLASRQTIGGYPKIATVIGVDLDQLGQLRPGDGVRFTAVSVAEARAATLAFRASLGDEAIVVRPRARIGWTPPGTAHDARSTGVEEAWKLPEIVRLIETIVAANVGWCRVEVGSTFSLEMRRTRSSTSCSGSRLDHRSSE